MASDSPQQLVCGEGEPETGCFVREYQPHLMRFYFFQAVLFGSAILGIGLLTYA